MSFFPDSELHKMHSQHRFYDAPPTPDLIQESCFVTSGSAPESHPSYESNALTWETGADRGLGLLSTTKLYPPSMVSPFSPQANGNIAFAWSQIMPSPQAISHDIPELPSPWTSTPSTTSQSAISSTMWSALPLSLIEPGRTTVYDASEYSTGSEASALSSPYVSSAHFAETAQSPSIKLEPSFEVANPPTMYQPRLVNPLDTVSHAPPTTPQVVFTPVLTPMTPAASESNDNLQCSMLKAEVFSVGGSSEKERRKRGFTTAAEATCSCHQCGKMFRRISNLAAHMQTHDEHRDHPWSCRFTDCKKRFNRRTDMERHVKSVHTKAMSYVCQACDRGFARKDTLCRHESAGCPRRAFIEARSYKKRRTTHVSNPTTEKSSTLNPSIQPLPPTGR